ncbi:MAG: YdcH family protein [Lysobacteraceae bacterium]
MQQPPNHAETVRRLAELRLEHRDLDAAIARLAADPMADQLQVRRLKKRKLAIKDCVARLESRLIPDLDA